MAKKRRRKAGNSRKAKPRARTKATSRGARKRASAEFGWGKPQKQPIELYYWPTPNGWKISIMLEECGLPYEVKPVNIGSGAQFTPEFERVSPNNRIPAIVDPEGPDGKPISVFESGAILAYLGRKSGKFFPAEPRRLVQVEEWLYWQVGNLGPLAGQAHHFRLYAPEKIAYAIQRYETQVRRLYTTMNKRLATREFLCDEYSIADIASFGWARRWDRQGQNIEEFPNLKRWLDAIHARPAVKRALAIRVEEASKVDVTRDESARKFLFEHVAR